MGASIELDHSSQSSSSCSEAITSEPCSAISTESLLVACIPDESLNVVELRLCNGMQFLIISKQHAGITQAKAPKAYLQIEYPEIKVPGSKIARYTLYVLSKFSIGA